MKLLKITTLLITVLSLTHCGFVKDLMGGATDVADALLKPHCLEGKVRMHADLSWDWDSSKQTYEAKIAVSGDSLIIQLSQLFTEKVEGVAGKEKNIVSQVIAKGAEKKNVTCAEFTLPKETAMIQSFKAVSSSSNTEYFISGISAIGVTIDEKNCKIDQFTVRKPESHILYRWGDPEKRITSIYTIKSIDGKQDQDYDVIKTECNL